MPEPSVIKKVGYTFYLQELSHMIAFVPNTRHLICLQTQDNMTVFIAFHPCAFWRKSFIMLEKRDRGLQKRILIRLHKCALFIIIIIIIILIIKKNKNGQQRYFYESSFIIFIPVNDNYEYKYQK